MLESFVSVNLYSSKDSIFVSFRSIRKDEIKGITPIFRKEFCLIHTNILKQAYSVVNDEQILKSLNSLNTISWMKYSLPRVFYSTRSNNDYNTIWNDILSVVSRCITSNKSVDYSYTLLPYMECIGLEADEVCKNHAVSYNIVCSMYHEGLSIYSETTRNDFNRGEIITYSIEIPEKSIVIKFRQMYKSVYFDMNRFNRAIKEYASCDVEGLYNLITLIDKLYSSSLFDVAYSYDIKTFQHDLEYYRFKFIHDKSGLDIKMSDEPNYVITIGGRTYKGIKEPHSNNILFNIDNLFTISITSHSKNTLIQKMIYCACPLDSDCNKVNEPPLRPNMCNETIEMCTNEKEKYERPCFDKYKSTNMAIYRRVYNDIDIFDCEQPHLKNYRDLCNEYTKTIPVLYKVILPIYKYLIHESIKYNPHHRISIECKSRIDDNANSLLEDLMKTFNRDYYPGCLVFIDIGGSHKLYESFLKLIEQNKFKYNTCIRRVGLSSDNGYEIIEQKSFNGLL